MRRDPGVSAPCLQRGNREAHDPGAKQGARPASKRALKGQSPVDSKSAPDSGLLAEAGGLSPLEQAVLQMGEVSQRLM